jgi:hypothetical protein
VSEVNHGDRDAASSSLFSMVASDNAEVIPQDAPRGPETMWSVAANPFDEPGSAAPPGEPYGEPEAPMAPPPNGSTFGTSSGYDTGGGPQGEDHGPAGVGGEDPADAFDGLDDGSGPPPYGGWQEPPPHWDTASSPFRRSPVDTVGSIFSAEPVDHFDDVWETDEDDAWSTQAAPTPEGSLFSNGSHLGPSSGGGRRPDAGEVREPRGPASEDPWVITDRRWDDSGVDWWGAGGQSDASDVPPAEGWADHQGAGPEPVAADDAQGYETAILRLHPQDRERAHVALSVAGALLRDDEVVRGVVTGQMLGRPAAVVVTGERVLVVNDRRWQPVVDVFRIDADLVVRGRHDRHVAALSFADATRVSMIDGISEVLIAIELAERIRDAGSDGAG